MPRAVDFSMSQLILVRHCEASGQQPSAALTDTGLRQARTLAEFLSSMPVDRIVASAYVRAQQSIEPLAQRLGLPVQVDPRLNERNLSPRPIAGWRDVVRQSFEDWDRRAPGGESAREVLARAWACLNNLRDEGHRRPLVVTHGNLMSLVLHSLDPSFGYAGWLDLTNPDVYALQSDASGRLVFRRLWRPGDP